MGVSLRWTGELLSKVLNPQLAEISDFVKENAHAEMVQ
jgi:hypothetical protein